jgi:hypothetical protein
MVQEKGLTNKHGKVFTKSDDFMVEAGLRQPKVEVVNFSKTKEEHNKLKEVKPLLVELEEIIIQKEESIQNKVIQLQEENKRLSHL